MTEPRIVEAEVRRALTATNRTLPTANAELDLYAPGSKPLAPKLKAVFAFGEAVVVMDKASADEFAEQTQVSAEQIAGLEEQVQALQEQLRAATKVGNNGDGE